MEETIGSVLNKARLKKGYTLDDLQQITKIQKRYLMAIEDDSFDMLPGSFYARAFVKQVAETLGFNGEEFLNRFEDQLPQRPSPSQIEVQESISRSLLKQQNQTPLGRLWALVQNYLPTILIATFGIILLFAVFQSFLKNNQTPSVTPSLDTSQTTTQAGEATTQTTQSTTQAQAESITFQYESGNALYYTAYLKDYPAQVLVDNQASTAMWSLISADALPLAEGLPEYGQSVTAEIPEGTQTITMQFGYAPIASIRLNQLAVEIPEGSQANIIYITIETGDANESAQ